MARNRPFTCQLVAEGSYPLHILLYCFTLLAAEYRVLPIPHHLASGLFEYSDTASLYYDTLLPLYLLRTLPRRCPGSVDTYSAARLLRPRKCLWSTESPALRRGRSLTALPVERLPLRFRQPRTPALRHSPTQLLVYRRSCLILWSSSAILTCAWSVSK